MTRDELLKKAPPDDATRPSFRNTVEGFVGEILNWVEGEDRQPDSWEAFHIAAALGYVAAGCYRAALDASKRTLVPVEHRLPSPPNLAGDAPAVRRFRNAHLGISKIGHLT